MDFIKSAKQEESKEYNMENFYYYMDYEWSKELDKTMIHNALKDLKLALEDYYGGEEHSAIISTAIENFTKYVKHQTKLKRDVV